MRNALLASVSSRFAHLANFGRGRSKAKAEDEKDDDEKKDAKRAEDEDEDEDKERAEDEKDDKEAARAEEDDEEKDDDEEEKSSRKSKKAEDDEDKGDEKEAKAFARGRRAERQRWATVFAASVAGHNVQLAATLLADTKKPAAAIISMLAQSDGRRDRNPRIDASAPERNDTKRIEASWEVAIKRAAGVR